MRGTAIVTKFLGPTNNRGSRVKAIIPSGKSVTLHWDHSIDASDNHLRAAAKAYEKFILCHVDGDKDRAPWVRMTTSAAGVNGLLHIVTHCFKEHAPKY